jgi:hypothetical protein
MARPLVNVGVFSAVAPTPVGSVGESGLLSAMAEHSVLPGPDRRGEPHAGDLGSVEGRASFAQGLHFGDADARPHEALVGVLHAERVSDFVGDDGTQEVGHRERGQERVRLRPRPEAAGHVPRPLFDARNRDQDGRGTIVGIAQGEAAGRPQHRYQNERDAGLSRVGGLTWANGFAQVPLHGHPSPGEHSAGQSKAGVAFGGIERARLVCTDDESGRLSVGDGMGRRGVR